MKPTKERTVSVMFLQLQQTCTKLYTILIALVTHTNSISVGMSQGFSAVLLPQLENSLIKINSEDASWIASLGVISTPPGALLSGLLAEAVGRKKTIQLTAVPFLVGWIMMALAQNKMLLYIGRFVTGFAIGMASTCYVYLAEISMPGERGMLASLGPVFVSFGVLLVYLSGYFMNWHLACVVCGATAAFSLVVIHFLPETPPWLVSKGKYEDAHKVVVSLRGSAETAQKEMNQMLESIDTENKLSIKEYLAQFKEPGVWKPFLILVFFFICQEGSGMYILVYYTTNIFRDIGPIFDSSVESIFVGVVRLLTSAVGSLCIQTFGRRPLAMFSGLGMGLSMGVAAIYEYKFGHLLMEDRPCSYIPFVCFILNVVASMLGMLQLPWLMIGELFPLSVRGFMSGVVSSLGYLFIFAIIKIYPNLMALQLFGMMTLFSITSLLTVVFVYFFLPETQGRLLIDIENSFKKKKEPIKDPIYTLKTP